MKKFKNIEAQQKIEYSLKKSVYDSISNECHKHFRCNSHCSGHGKSTHLSIFDSNDFKIVIVN